MTKQGKQELLKAVRSRYRKASKREKSRIPDEFVAATGYIRKYAIHLLRNGPSRPSRKKRGRRLKRARSKLTYCGRSTTKPGTLLQNAIPIRTFADWDEQRPGFVEMDLVAHCGASTTGEFLHTLNVVYIDTRWTEPIALPNKGQKATFEGIQTMRRRLPFPLLGIDSDSGGEFINYHLYNYCQDEKITFTRARPYKKNDQAYIEQRNWTVVRQVVGYARYESPGALTLLQNVYENLRLFVNFLQPVMNLESKSRVGSKVRKKYDVAQTPCQRVLASAHVDQSVKQRFSDLYTTLNPAELSRRIEANLAKLWRFQRYDFRTRQ